MAGRDVTQQVLEMGHAANLRAQGLTVPEIAARLGLPIRTTKRRLALARQFVMIAQSSPVPDGAGLPEPDGSVTGCDLLPSGAPGHHHPEQEDHQ